eukprot:13990978-Alexandrium_andersonii.AAC.1
MWAPTSAAASSTTGSGCCRRPPWRRSVQPSGSSHLSCTRTRTRAPRLHFASSASRTPTASWAA